MLDVVFLCLRRAPWRCALAGSLAFSCVTGVARAGAEDARLPAAGDATGVPAPEVSTLGAPAERVRITYRLGTDCPAPDAFERELDARLGSTWKAAPDELARLFVIEETPSGDIRVVRMEYEDEDGRTITRSVSAPTCDEALSLMAVITSVAIEAQRRKAAPKSAAARETTPPVSRPEKPTPRVQPTTVVDTDVASPHTFEHEAGLRFLLSSGFGTRAALGAGAEWGLVVDESFEVRAAVEARDTGTVPADDARARFRSLTARGDVCVATLRLTSWLGVPLCAGLEAGVLWAEGVPSPPTVASVRSSYVPWIAGLVTPRVRLSGLRAYLELVPEIRIPFSGHSFLFEAPERTAYQTPDIAFGASLGAGLRFH